MQAATSNDSIGDAERAAFAAGTLEAAAVYAKISRRLIPLLFACYVSAYLDRVNVGFAKLQMLEDLSFSETVYGLGAGIFFIGYFLCELPSNLVLHRVGARRWIARIMISWALISAATMFVTTPRVFYLLRFLLGMAEAGLFPGLILYLTYWFPARHRGKVFALFLAGMPAAGLIGGPASGLIMRAMDGVHGLAGWQWLFVLEAIPSIALGVIVLSFLDDHVADAAWLSQEERELVARDLARDAESAASHSLGQVFNPQVWLMAAIYFFLAVGVYGIGFFLPTLIRDSGVEGAFSIGMLTALPYLAALVTMILVGRSSDARRERRYHLLVPALIGATAWLCVVLFDGKLLLSLAALTVVTSCVIVTISQFWCLPTAILSGTAAAAGIALVNSIGNLSGFLGPFLIGWISDRTGSLHLGVLMLAASLVLASLLIGLVNPKVVNR